MNCKVYIITGPTDLPTNETFAGTTTAATNTIQSNTKATKVQ